MDTLKHYAVTDRASGETAFVIVPRMQTPADCGYSAETHDWFRVVRAPGECDRLEGKVLRQCPEAAERLAYEARLAAMTRAELVEFILTLVRAER